MSNKTELKENLKKEKARLHEDILSLKKSVSDYKVGRQDEWKEFKNKANDEVKKIKHSLDELTARYKNKDYIITN
ncbi:MAG: hypothetical protein ABIP79_14360 [Chitinophagaceae bacterium]